MRTSKTLSLTIISLLAAAALVLAACGGSDSADAGAGAGSVEPSTTVAVQSIDGMQVLVDPDGRALYTADQEAGGKVLCTDGCTSIWDPVTVTGEEPNLSDVDQSLDIVERPDGDRQLSFEGKPLYRFTEEGAGQLTGDGFVDDFEGTRFEWHAALTGDGAGPPSSEDSSPPAVGPGGY